MLALQTKIIFLIVVCCVTIAASQQSQPAGGSVPSAPSTSVTIPGASPEPSARGTPHSGSVIVSGGGANAPEHANQSPEAAEEPQLLTRSKKDRGLRIGGGDLIQVSVLGAPDYAREVRVAEDGTVDLPFVGHVPVAGRTPSEVASDLQVRLTKGGYFNDPQVAVNVKEYATQGVSVLGEVQKPGVYPLLGSRTLFDALSAAQGTTQTAGDTVYITHRDSPGQPQAVKISYDATGLAQSNVPVFPGDTIVVQKAGMVYVVGNVQKPTGIVMAAGDLTVLKAIALAQGFSPNAALGKARLVRKTSDGQTAVPLQLKKMLDAKAPDVRLQAGDILFVPNSVASSAFKKSLELALQTASGVIIYGRF